MVQLDREAIFFRLPYFFVTNLALGLKFIDPYLVFIMLYRFLHAMELCCNGYLDPYHQYLVVKLFKYTFSFNFLRSSFSTLILGGLAFPFDFSVSYFFSVQTFRIRLSLVSF